MELLLQTNELAVSQQFQVTPWNYQHKDDHIHTTNTQSSNTIASILQYHQQQTLQTHFKPQYHCTNQQSNINLGKQSEKQKKSSLLREKQVVLSGEIKINFRKTPSTKQSELGMGQNLQNKQYKCHNYDTMQQRRLLDARREKGSQATVNEKKLQQKVKVKQTKKKKPSLALTLNSFKPPKPIAKPQWKSTTIGCLFSANVQAAKQSLNPTQAPAQAKPNKHQPKVLYQQKNTISYPILQHHETQSKTNRESNQQSNNRLQCGHNRSKLNTLRHSSNGQEEFLRPKRQMRTRNKFYKKSHLMPGETQFCYVKKHKTQHQQLAEKKDTYQGTIHYNKKTQYLKPTIHQQSDSKGISRKDTALHPKSIVRTQHVTPSQQCYSSGLNPVEKSTVSLKNLMKEETLKVKRGYFDGESLLTKQRISEENLIKKVQLAMVVGGNARERRRRELTVEQKIGDKFIRPLKENTYNDIPTGKKLAIPAESKPSLLYLPRKSVTVHKSSHSQTMILPRPLNQHYASKSILPKIQLCYQNQSQHRVKKVFETSKVQFYGSSKVRA